MGIPAGHGSALRRFHWHGPGVPEYPPAMTEPVEIRENPRALRFQAGIMLAAALPTLLVALGRVLQDMLQLQTWLILTVGLGLLLGAAINLRDARARRIRLTLDQGGIRDHSRSDGAFRWDEIAGVELVQRHGGLRGLNAHVRFDLAPPRGGKLVIHVQTLQDPGPRIAEGLRRFAPQVPRAGL